MNQNEEILSCKLFNSAHKDVEGFNNEDETKGLKKRRENCNQE